MQLLSILLSLPLTTSALVLSPPLPTATRASAPAMRPRSDITASPSASTPTGYFYTTQHVVLPGQTDAHVTIPAKTIDIVIPTCVHTIEPDKNGYVPPGSCGALYDYYPSFVAAAVFSGLFGVLMMLHIAQAAKLKSKFSWVVIMGAIWETAAFVFRTISTKHQQSAGIDLVSTIFVLLAPLWINAYAYMVLARMIHFFHPARRILSIPSSTLSIIFVTLDIISFAIQLTGGSYATRSDPEAKQMKGIHIYMGGIGLQQFFIFVFLGIAIKFHIDMKKSKLTKPGWSRLMWTLYASLLFVTVRIFYRLIEFSAGENSSNPLPVHEIYFYVLEAVPMCLALLAFNVTHPSSILKGPEADLPKLNLWKRRGGFRKIGVDDGEILLESKPPPYRADMA